MFPFEGAVELWRWDESWISWGENDFDYPRALGMMLDFQKTHHLAEEAV